MKEKLLTRNIQECTFSREQAGARGSRDVFNSGRFQKQRKKLTTRGRARNGLKPPTLKQEVPSNCKIGLFTNFLLGSNSSGRCGVSEERRGGDGFDLDFLQLAIDEHLL